MIIALCASKSFNREVAAAALTLRRRGHRVVLPGQEGLWGDHGKERADESVHEFTNEYQIMQAHYQRIQDADALLVLNYRKYGTPGYVGGGMLMEMGFAHALGKQVFLLFSIPRLPYADEIKVTNPILLDGDLTRIEKQKGANAVMKKKTGDRVIAGKIKRVMTRDAMGKENGFLMEIEKAGRFTKVYLTGVMPGAFKGYHLHRVRETNYVAVRGKMRVVLYTRKGSKWVRSEYTLDSAKGDTLHIPTNVATGFSSADGQEAWLINVPHPYYDPQLKGEQVEYTEQELRAGIVK